MKNLKKILALVMVVAMMAALGVCAFAQEVAATTKDADAATITINNASKGETYTVYQLFDATVSVATTDGKSDAVALQVMSGSAAPTKYFSVDAKGNVTADATTTDTTVATAEFKTWAVSYGVERASATSDGSTLTFTDLPYGYYYVASTQGATITVTATDPSASVNDKNSTPPLVKPSKVVSDTDVYIGETVTYTLKVKTANYDGTDIITNYYIKDTLPEFLTFGEITGFSISTTDLEAEVDGVVPDLNNTTVTLPTSQYTGTTYPQFNNGEMTIAWADSNGSLYTNGSYIYVTYTATVNDKIALGQAGNANTLSYTYSTNNGKQPYDENHTYEDTATICTYAAAIQKTDDEHDNLAGATFTVKGLTVTGAAGSYIVSAYDPNSNTASAVMECDANGKLVIIGVPSDVTLVATEVAAPDGYNKLTTTVDVTPTKVAGSKTITKTSTTTYYDAEGKETDEVTETSTVTSSWSVDASAVTAVEVQNFAGATLPSTGGMGTTIFYVIGGILVLGAGILLVTKKRMAANG